MENPADLDLMGLPALLAPLVLEETSLLNMMAGKDLTLALDQWV